MKPYAGKIEYGYFNTCKKCGWFFKDSIDITNLLPCPKCGCNSGYKICTYTRYVSCYKRKFSILGFMPWLFGMPKVKLSDWQRQ